MQRTKCSFQTWRDNMSKTDPPKISTAADDDYTCVTFSPDLQKFKMNNLDEDIIGLMSRRAYDMAGTTRGVKVYLNGKRLPVIILGSFDLFFLCAFKNYVCLCSCTCFNFHNAFFQQGRYTLSLLNIQIKLLWYIKSSHTYVHMYYAYRLDAT